MKILFLGDVVGKVGRRALNQYLPQLVKKYQVDFVIANGENVTHGKGLNERHYYELLNAGVNVITLGNHYLGKFDINNYIEDAEYLVRPLNILKPFGGVGSLLINFKGVNIRVTNLLGTAFIKEEVIQPYQSMMELFEEIKDEDSIHIVDFHGEATGEKMCYGYLLDGKVSAVLGTHTHVQTNDAKILANGTAFISDVGMCGANNGVLGFDKDLVINKTIFGSEVRFAINEKDKAIINGVVLSIDEETKKCNEIITVKFIEE